MMKFHSLPETAFFRNQKKHAGFIPQLVFVSSFNSNLRMKKKHYLFPAALLMLCFHIAGAQKWNWNNARSEMAYIFRISNEQALALIEKPALRADSTYCQQPADSFPSGQPYPNLKTPGYYLLVQADEMLVRQELVCVTNLQPRIIGNQKRFELTLADKITGRLITDAEIYAGTTKIPYDPATKTYHAKKLKRPYRLQIRAAGEVIYCYAEKGGNNRLRSYQADNGSFIVFNKPKYLPGDTVMLKMHYQRKGKMSTKELRLEISRNWEYGDPYGVTRTVVDTLIRPSREGVYLFRFVVGDTLLIDRSYEARFYQERRRWDRTVCSGSFRIEDYQLDDMRVDAWMTEKNYSSRDSVVLMIKAEDANNLPVTDGKAVVRIVPEQLRYFENDGETVSLEPLKETQPLNPDGITRIAFAPKRFSASAVTYKVLVDVFNSNNELQRDSCRFTMEPASQDFRFRESGDSVTVTYLSQGRPQPLQGFMWQEFDSDTSRRVPVSFPYSFRRNPAAEGYYFSGNQIVSHYAQDDQELEIFGQRTADSIVVTASGKYKMTFHCEVYRKGVLLHAEDTNRFRYIARDDSEEPYEFHFRYYYGGSGKTVIRTFRAADRTLQVSLDEPDQVYPGQKADITVKVTDYKGKPVPAADVTALAINAQFDENPLQDVPNFNRTEGLKKKRMTKYRLFLRDYSASFVPTHYWYHRLHLDSIHRYQLTMPGNRVYRRQLPVSEKDVPQFSFMIVPQHQNGAPVMVYLDDQLVHADLGYLRKNYWGKSSPFSFVAAPGMHRVRIRMRDAEYLVDSVEIIPGHKMEFAFDTRTLPAGVKKTACSAKLTPEEKSTLQQHLLFVSRRYRKDVFIRQENDIHAITNYRSYVVVRDTTRPFTVYTRQDREIIMRDFRMRPGRFNYLHTDTALVFTQTKTRFRKLKKRFNSFTTGSLATRVSQLPQEINVYDRYSYRDIPLPAHALRTTPGKSELLIVTANDSVKEKMQGYVLQNVNGRVMDAGITGERNNYYNNYRLSAISSRNLQPGEYKLTVYNGDGSFKQMKLVAHESAATAYRITGEGFSDPKGLQNDLRSDPLTIQYKPGGATISGHVEVSGAGTFVSPEGFTVAIGKGKSRSYSMTVERDGKFEFADVPAGIYNLYVGDRKMYGSLTVMGLVVTDDKSPVLLVRINVREEKDQYMVGWPGADNLIARPDRATDVYAPLFYLPLDRREFRLGEPWLFSGYSNYRYSYPYQKNLIGEADFDWNYAHLYFESGFDLDMPYFLRRFRPSRFAKRKVRAKFGGGSRAYASAYDWFDGSDASGRQESEPSRGAFEAKELAEVTVVTGGLSASFNLIPGVQGHADVRNFNNEYDRLALFAGKSLESDSLKALPQSPGGVRTKFSDYAYFRPLLSTDSKGEVRFTVNYPENLTGWRSYAVAMGPKTSGEKYHFTRSFKPLAASLAYPRFLVEGDTSQLVGKVFNYSDKEKEVSTMFTIDDRPFASKILTVKDAAVERMPVVAPQQGDSLEVEFKLTGTDGYVDGEKRSIPLFRKGVEETHGQFWYLEGDTSIRVRVNPAAEKVHINAFDNELDVLLDRIETIKSYEYECNEQLASKLRALLMEKKICAATGRAFKGENDIRKLLKRLDKNQLPDGSWGWWKNSLSSATMTLIVTDALLDAQAAGYVTNADEGIMFIYYNYGKWSAEQSVHALYLLSRSGKKQVDYAKALAELEVREDLLSTYSRYQLIRIRQMNRMDASAKIAALSAKKKSTVLGGAYWGEHGTDWYGNSTRLTLLVYHIFEKDSSRKNELKDIRNYFLEPNNENAFRNTYESAEILTALLPAYLAEYKKEGLKSPGLQVSGAATFAPAQFPLVKTFKPSSGELTVKKTGTAPLYLTVFEKKWNPDPAPKEDLFAVSTSFVSNGKVTDTLEAGKPVVLKVDVEAKKKGNYVMIEVPIPAGCSYDANRLASSSAESHREQFKNKTSIFCESLPEGKYTFYIALQPRYSGSYTLNAAKVEMMYFPTFYGRCGQKRTVIK